jgi:hypothetical protein
MRGTRALEGDIHVDCETVVFLDALVLSRCSLSVSVGDYEEFVAEALCNYLLANCAFKTIVLKEGL